MPRARVLLIEDNPEDAHILQDALNQAKNTQFDIDWADRLAKGLTRLRHGDVQLVLTDLSLPDANGLDTVVKVHAAAKDTPIVVLTSSDDSALAMQALQQGAQDYLVKGYVQVYPDLLLRAIRYAIERKSAEARQQQLIEAAACAEKRRATDLEQAYRELQQTQAMLVQAEKMAAVGQLAGGIAHEVKNPLNIILQCINYLEPVAAASAEQAEILQAMRDSVMSADKIIRGLLDFARPATLKLMPTSLRAVIEASLHLAHSQFATKHVQCKIEVPDDLPMLQLDERQMKQVFINLFLNALHAMPKGGVLSVQARIARLSAPGCGVGTRASDTFLLGETVVVCEVSDTGPGIAEDMLSNVFNPFFTTKAPGEGIGLGLPITAAIMHAHRGTVHLDSVQGRGTTAVLRLPIMSARSPSLQMPDAA
jgi:signal transduction histidine kinase